MEFLQYPRTGTGNQPFLRRDAHGTGGAERRQEEFEKYTQTARRVNFYALVQRFHGQWFFD